MFPKKPDCILKAFSQSLGGFELASPSQLPQTLAEARQRDLEERPTYRGGGQKSGVIFRHVLVGNIQFLGDFLGDVDSFSVGTFFFWWGCCRDFWLIANDFSRNGARKKHIFSCGDGHRYVWTPNSWWRVKLNWIYPGIERRDSGCRSTCPATLHFIARSNVSRLVLNMADICRKRALGKCSKCTPLWKPLCLCHCWVLEIDMTHPPGRAIFL